MKPLAQRRSIEQVEEGLELAPKFGPDGLLPCITTDADGGEVLMLGWMNAEALQRTLATRQAHYLLEPLAARLRDSPGRPLRAPHAAGQLRGWGRPAAEPLTGTGRG